MKNQHNSRRTFLRNLGAGVSALSLPSLGYAHDSFTQNPTSGLYSPTPHTQLEELFQPGRKLGIALVGLGYYSTNLLAPALQQTQHCRLAGIVAGTPAKATEWMQKAELAVRQNKDDLAKAALVRHGEHLTHAQQLELTWQAHQSETEKLKASLRDLNDKIEEAKRKKNLLVARQRRAQAQKRIAETMSSMSEKSAFDAFARMEERIETNERQLKASVEIEEEFTGDRLAQDFKALERGATSNSVDTQLLALKQKMGMLPASAGKKALGAGAGGLAGGP